ncbi:O-antigen ligase family protein [Uliginosibacterium sp. H3]|uniref:O-antigen ligase family protein n=1 Tax=Uliginosibacterium silvisoli TaxID=3114758 RepID=A0ABU6K1G9_9RHOO|nr:O-antigen ligase family protein [Uliginosibacterium sp. H3]
MLRDASPQSRTLNRTEFVLLCLFSIALPLVEAPKNIFWALFLLLWIGRSAYTRNWGHLSRGWDLLFVGLILVPTLSCLLTPYSPQWKEMGDIVGYVSLGWILARSRLTPDQLKWLFASLIGATIAGVVHGFAVMQLDPKRVWLQLNSVGHVNHSALYAAGIGILATACAALSASRFGRRAWQWSVLSATFMLAAMIIFGSRGALIAYLFGALPVLLILSNVRLQRLLPVIAGLMVAGVLVGVIGSKLSPSKGNLSIVEKTEIGIKTGNFSSFRLQSLQTAIELMHQNPLTGAGPANFNAASPELVRTWVEARQETFQRERYFFSSHAHGLFANTLGERGLLGEGILLTLLIGWTIALLRRRPARDASFSHALSWGAGFAGWSVVFVGGLFNTTLHHEHGMLAMMGLGLLLALDVRSKASQKPD